MNESEKHQELCRLCGSRPPWTDHMRVCGVCLGFEKTQEDPPLPAHEVTNYDPKAENAARLVERPCSSCGRTPSQTKFYPSRKDKCVECIKAKDMARRAGQPPTYTVVEETTEDKLVPAIPLTPPLDPVVSAEIDAQEDWREPEPTVVDEPQDETCKCRECGTSFTAYQSGAVKVSNYCADCLAARLKASRKPESRRFLLSLDLEQEKEIFDALAESAARERRSMVAQAVTLLERVLLNGKG